MDHNPSTSRGRKKSSGDGITTADAIVLSLLAERPMHGYELLGEYERQEVADWASVSKAQVYYAIQKLERLGLIQPDKTINAQEKRDKTVYRPTKSGMKSLVTSLTNPQWAKSRIAQPFSTWLGMSIHLESSELKKMIDARKVFLETEIAREEKSLAFIKTIAAPRARVGENIVELVISQLKTELDWIKSKRARKFI